MITKEEIQNLAKLARIRIDENELDIFAREFETIVAYVGQLEKLDLPKGDVREKPPLRNVMRVDGVPHAAGAFTEKIAEQFPKREGDYLAVKQIISHESR